MSEGIELRAFRGTRRSSTYRAHAIPEAAARRLAGVAAAGGFAGLAAVARGEEGAIDKRSARRLADEATGLRSSALALELDDDLTALAEVANWCARARGRAWLQVRPRE
jgi:hypothetical protein